MTQSTRQTPIEPCSDFLASTLASASASRQHWKLADGTTVCILAPGAIELTPAHIPDADRILLSSGIHGNETAPIEVVNALLNDILQGRLSLTCHLMVLFGNPQAMRQGERYLDYDMNRLFDGAHLEHPGARDSQRAAALERLAAALFDGAPAGARRLHLDLHTAIRGSVYPQFAIYPFLHQRAHKPELLAWLQDCEIDTVLLHSKPANTFSYFTSQGFGADSLTLELGRALPFGHNRLEDFAAIDRGLRQLVSTRQPEPRPLDLQRLRLFAAKYDLIKHSDAFVLHLDDAVENFTPLNDGMLIAEDGAKRYVAQGGEERILFPNPTVKNGLRAGIVVEPVSL
jgi:succinylglutamate desuccinylase